MDNFEMIKSMLDMQRELDKEMFAKGNVTWNDIEFDRSRRAIIDEIGELNHELKGEWCWWKKTQQAPDQKKVLEELVDVWHFVLSVQYHIIDSIPLQKDAFIKKCLKHYDEYKCDDNTGMLFVNLCLTPTLNLLLRVTKKLGFTVSEVYSMYLEKNRINHERVKNGY